VWYKDVETAYLLYKRTNEKLVEGDGGKKELAADMLPVGPDSGAIPLLFFLSGMELKRRTARKVRVFWRNIREPVVIVEELL